MPRRPVEVADVGFSLPGLTSYLQGVIKQQQRSFCTRVVCSSSAGGLALCCSSLVELHLSHGHGKVLLETGSENPSWVGSELADTTSLGAQSNLKALVLVGCEQRMKLGCRSWVGFNGSQGKIPLSRGWAAHTDDQLHLPADRVSQSQDCFPAWSLSPWMGNVLHPSDWLCSASHSTASLEVLWIWRTNPDDGLGQR